MTLQITALYAGILALILLGLSANVSRLRRQAQIGIGHGDNPALERAVRVHGNFTEYVPLGLLLVALCELNGAPVWSLHALGAALLVGRILHAVGLGGSAGVTLQRLFGTTLTWLVLLFGGLTCLYLALA